MKKKSTTGNAINVANLELLIAYLVAMGASYNPSNQTLTIANITIKLNLGKTKLQSVNTTFNGFNSTRNLRRTEFKPLKKLCTRIINALIACGASSEMIANAKTINRKIQGGRAKSIITPVPATQAVTTPIVETEPTVPDGVLKSTIIEIKNISVSQQGFDSTEDNFAKLLTLLLTEVLYQPNETDLTSPSLSLKQDALKQTNLNVKAATPAYTNSLTSRDIELYQTTTGLVDLALLSKNYCLSVLSASNPNYKTINKIHFKNFK